MAETLDGLYTPYSLLLPEGDGPHPYVLIAYGNGGGGTAWLEDRVHRFRHITDVLLEAGYACGWVRYRTEVELGYQNGGPLITTVRQGMGLMNRSPLEYEDEVAVLRDVATHPAIDGDRLFHVGVSHAGEMLFKLLSQYPGLLRAGVAAEPASHELLTLRLDDVDTVTTTDGLRDIESMEIRSVDRARARVTDPDEVSKRLDGVDIPVLVLGRDQDELQGIFRLTYELLAEKRDDAEWSTGPTHPRLHLSRGRRLRRPPGRRRPARGAVRHRRLPRPPPLGGRAASASERLSRPPVDSERSELGGPSTASVHISCPAARSARPPR